MSISLNFVRTFFFLVSVSIITFTVMHDPEGTWAKNSTWGLSLGLLLGSTCLILDFFLRKSTLRSFHSMILGGVLGYFFGHMLIAFFDSIISFCPTPASYTSSLIHTSLLLLGTYTGMIWIVKASEEFCISIPFIKLTSTGSQKPDLLLDHSALADSRLVDLATTGLLNHMLILPRFLVKELYTQIENEDDHIKNKAKKSLNTVKTLETIPGLGLRFSEMDFTELHDSTNKLFRLAKLIDAGIISADLTRSTPCCVEGISIINLHTISQALKPLTQTGEILRIKVQRHGKEPCQGVGYLEDGTMVVVNSGGKYLGAFVDAQVLSVKHTTAGRMVFCNACEEKAEEELVYEYKK